MTGAAGALGSIIADELAARGWSLVLSGLPTDDCDAVAERLVADHDGAQACVIPADLREPSQIRRLVEEAVAWKGHLDCLVNNAGRPSRSSIATITVEEWEASLRVNLSAPMLLIQAFAANFRRDNGPGSIINMTSRTYASGGPVAYVSSKAGLVGLTRAAAYEFGPHGIRVNAVAPSLMDTPFTAGSRTDEEMAEYMARQAQASALKRSPDLREVATTVAFLAGRDSSFMTGEVVHVAGGLQLPPVF